LHGQGTFVGHIGGFPFKRPRDANLVGEVFGRIGGVPEGEVGDDRGREGREGRECPVAEGSHDACGLQVTMVFPSSWEVGAGANAQDISLKLRGSRDLLPRAHVFDEKGIAVLH
jgi:hypothetical protein